ncbi:hypothetical protein OF846_004195 [Rhodotorula toruloides]|nr:hypothetical protein OF846_004195 [Rhodotorula toruloides]
MSLEVRTQLAPSRNPCSSRPPLSQTSSPAHRKRPFPLLRLPYELLDTIFAYAYEDDEHPEPVCRALRQFAERRFYRDVKLVNYSFLADFCSTINESKRLAQLVRTLDLDFSCCEEENDPEEHIEPGHAQRTVTVKSFTKVLSRLIKLKSLRMVELDKQLSQVLSSTRLDSSALPELEVLDLHEIKTCVLDEGVWARRLSMLREVRLHSFVGPIRLPRAATTMQADTLALSGDGRNPWPGYELCKAFPALIAFEARDLMDRSQYLSVVHGLPRTLKRLRLEQSVDFVAPGSLDDILPEFRDLDSLYLCNGTFTLPRLTSYLVAAVNLVSLGFSIGAPLTDRFLLWLVKGPTRPAHLQTLVLDYVTCRRGLTMKSQGYKLSKDADQGYKLSKDAEFIDQYLSDIYSYMHF